MKSVSGTVWSAVLVGVCLCAGVSPVMARDHGWHGDIRHFERHDARHWHSGAWRHGHHGNRLGWWWVVGGLSYAYARPVYPYPDPYRPSVVVIEQPAPPVVYQAPPPAPSMPPVAAPAPVQYWYYCEGAKGYYPYVPACPTGWSKVPATPPGATP